MKQILLFIALLSIPFSNFGQSEFHRLDSVDLFQNIDDNWQKIAVNQYQYDSLGRFTKELLKFVGESDLLEDYYSIEFSYHNDLITNAVYSGFTDMMGFHPFIKVEADYNSNELVQQEIHHSWDIGLDAWKKDRKIEYIYQDEMLILKTVFYFPNCKSINEWIELEKHEFEWDDNNKLVSHISSDWHEKAWEGNAKKLYSYDENGNEIEMIEYSMFGSDDWVAYNKTEKVINDLGYFIDQIDYRYNEINEWEREKKYSYDHDEFGNLITSTQAIWIEENWVESSILDYTLNTNTNSEDLVLPLFIDPFGVLSKDHGIFLDYSFKDDFHYMLDKEELSIWNFSDEQWANHQYRQFYFSEHINGTDELSQQDILSYPNPVDKTIYFKLGNNNPIQIKVFDINGKFIMSHNMTKQSMNVSRLNEGLYFYELIDKEITLKGKFIVQH